MSPRGELFNLTSYILSTRKLLITESAGWRAIKYFQSDSASRSSLSLFFLILKTKKEETLISLADLMERGEESACNNAPPTLYRFLEC